MGYDVKVPHKSKRTKCIIDLHNTGMKVTDISKNLNVSIQAVYQTINRNKKRENICQTKNVISKHSQENLLTHSI
jgi:Mor family transcriptional regulator